MFRRKKYDQGTYVAFPKYRRTVLDICQAASTVPAFAVDRRIQLERVLHARKAVPQRIGWAAIFAKAYSLVAAEVPQLRQTYISYPWPRLYQHPKSIVSITVNRYDPIIDAERLLFSRIRNVEDLALPDVQGAVDVYQNSDTNELFREGRLLESMPTFVRRLSWHMMMRWMGRKRARMLGTFTLSTLAPYGTTNHSHPLVVTSSLTYGPLEDDFCSRVTLIADHRVVDGAIIARALVRLEEVMNNEILVELRQAAVSQKSGQRKAG